MSKKNQIITSAIVLLVIALGAFYGGMLFGQNQKRGLGFQGPGQNISIRGNRQGSTNMGEIISKDDKSVTIKLTTGGSKIVFFSATTEVGKFVSGTSTDLEVGKTIMVQGQANQDGSITAQSIQLRPNLKP